MKDRMDRRSFLKISGMSLGIGVVYQFAPMLAHRAEAGQIADFFKQVNGESPQSFTFAQFSDPHVGFQGPPDPLGTKAFENAVELLNRAPQRPDFVLFTGDLTHDVEARDVHAQRMQLFKSISGRINTSAIHTVPGENDAALDGGVLYREHFGESHYSFDHRGVHFVALDNVSRGHPEVGADQLAWMKADIARFPKTAPIVVFTHRPLFDLKPEWEWFTADGDEVMNVLSPYENVTVLYGHIHRQNFVQRGNAKHYAARSLIFAFNDPATNADKKQMPFDKDQPFQGLGIRLVGDNQVAKVRITDVELTTQEFAACREFNKSTSPTQCWEGVHQMMPTRKIAAAMAIVLGGVICAISVHAPIATGDTAETTPQVIKITASKFHFEPDHITLHKGQPVTLQLTSLDATHGFMIRALKIDTAIKPSTVTEITVTPDTTGNYTAICDHYCGLGHGMMKLKVEVEP